MLQKENSLCRSFVCVDICVGSFNVHWLEYGVITFCMWKVIYIFICVAYVFGLGSPTCLIHQTNVSYRSSQVFASKLAWKPDNKLHPVILVTKCQNGGGQEWSWSSDGVYPKMNLETEMVFLSNNEAGVVMVFIPMLLLKTNWK